MFTSFSWEGQNGHFLINLTTNLTDFDGNGNEGSVNYSDGSEECLKISMAVREEIQFLMTLRELAHLNLPIPFHIFRCRDKSQKYKNSKTNFYYVSIN
jgi:hypothetical protein